MVGRAIAGRLSELGHDVVVGTRDPEATLAREVRDSMGNPPFSEWADEHPQVGLARFDEASAASDLLVLATSGAVALETLAAVGEANLGSKVLIDITNPLDFSRGMPPTLFVKDDDSLGEQIQRAHPRARVVKTLNTLNADLMVHPGGLPEGTTVFVAGEDARAKAEVVALLESFGHTDVLDLGGISSARGVEMWLPLWLRIMGTLGTSVFNLRIVR